MAKVGLKDRRQEISDDGSTSDGWFNMKTLFTTSSIKFNKGSKTCRRHLNIKYPLILSIVKWDKWIFYSFTKIALFGSGFCIFPQYQIAYSAFLYLIGLQWYKIDSSLIGLIIIHKDWHKVVFHNFIGYIQITANPRIKALETIFYILCRSHTHGPIFYPFRCRMFLLLSGCPFKELNRALAVEVNVSF